jgi:coenzyme F420-0:L-glutamate ligase/coenzyme F420-1:gamma-L-glutamate ligase
VSAALEAFALLGVGEIGEGDAIGRLVASAAEAGPGIESSDVVVVSQKAVSKAEGRIRDLAKVKVGAEARELASRIGKDPRLVELILGESRSVVRAEPGVLIVKTRGGWVCANAGVDSSNVPGAEQVALLPVDADASARRIRAELREACGKAPAVVIADSFGRPWRLGQTDVAIGCAGLLPLDDWRGREDAHGATLGATVLAVADELAAAADLVRDKSSGSPFVIVRGVGERVTLEDGPGARAMQRRRSADLFR